MSPRLTFLGFQSGAAALRLQGEANRLYQIDASLDLVSWTNKTSVFTATGDFTYLDADGAQLRQFYRARVGE